VFEGSLLPRNHDWEAHGKLGRPAGKRAAKTRTQTPGLLKGLIFGPTGHAMVMTHTRPAGVLFDGSAEAGARGLPWRVLAGEVETVVPAQVRHLRPR